MDYLRQVGGSKEAAKELKLFNLSDYLTNRFRALSQQIYDENVELSKQEAALGRIAVAHRHHRLLRRVYLRHLGRRSRKISTIGVFSLVTAAIQQAQANFQQAFSTASGIADQALFLTDLIAFFEMKPTVESKPNALPAPRPIRKGFEFRNVSFAYPGTDRAVLKNFNFTIEPGERIALIGENGQGKDHRRQADHPALRPHRRRDSARRRRPPRLFHRRSASRDGRHLSGLHALRDDGAGKHRDRPRRSSRTPTRKLKMPRTRAWPPKW